MRAVLVTFVGFLANWTTAVVLGLIVWSWHRHRLAKGTPVSMTGVLSKVMLLGVGLHFAVLPVARVFGWEYAKLATDVLAGSVSVMAYSLIRKREATAPE